MVAIVPINYIEIRRGDFGERAVVAGTGVKVDVIAVMHVYNNSSIEWIAENFDLSPAQIYAALSYYYDHKDEIDQRIAEGEQLAEELGTPAEEVLERMRRRLKEKNG
jgi:uncharacterized protein (DUF433 family)